MESLGDLKAPTKGRQNVLTKGPTFSDLPGTIAYLKSQFPDTCPALSLADREIWFRAGQASVWKHLLSVLEDLEERELETSQVQIRG
jgi:hypothetical protein